MDRKGERRTLSEGWGTLRGLAWSSDGGEVWFTADRGGAARGLYAVSLGGTLRRVLQLASNLTVYDIARDGRVLVGHGPERAGINALAPGETRERVDLHTGERTISASWRPRTRPGSTASAASTRAPTARPTRTITTCSSSTCT